MGLDWRVLGIGLVLIGCTPTDTSVSQRDILDDYKALNVRLESLAYPLLAGNHDICDQTTNDNGIRWHQLDEYPEDLQPVAQSYWEVSDERSVFYVLPHSEAEGAGIRSGDRPSKKVLDEIPEAAPICKYQVLVSYTDEINAYATGNEIIVTSGMLRSISDDQYLTLVLAHEMSHNILDHIGNPDVIDREAQADEAAVKLMARAGLDYQDAIRRRESHQIKTANGAELPAYQLERIENFKTYSQRIKSRQDAGKALWP